MRIALLFMLAWLAAAGGVAAGPVDAIVARIDGDPIMLSQVRMAAVESDIPLPALASRRLDEQTFRHALTLLVDDTLLLQQARRDGLRNDPMRTSREIDRMLAELERRLGSSRAMELFLEEQRIGLEQLRELMLEREERRWLATEVVARRVRADAEAVEGFRQRRIEQDQPLEEVRLAHILIRLDGERRDGERGRSLHRLAWELARSAQARPESFAELAAEHSHDRATAAAGGDLGWLDPRGLRSQLGEAAGRLDPGQISEPVWTGEGWHVMRLIGRRDTRDLYYAEQFALERERLVRRLRAEAQIRVYDPRVVR